MLPERIVFKVNHNDSDIYLGVLDNGRYKIYGSYVGLSIESLLSNSGRLGNVISDRTPHDFMRSILTPRYWYPLKISQKKRTELP